jgi:hypothetical protein
VVSAAADGTAITQTATVTVTSPGSSVVFVGAGDIADCGSSHDEATADLINALPTADVFTLGDNVYPNGTLNEFNTCYHRAGGFKPAPTHPPATMTTTPPGRRIFRLFRTCRRPRGAGLLQASISAPGTSSS